MSASSHPGLKFPKGNPKYLTDKIRAKEIRAHEEREKRKVRKRDPKCRYPHCLCHVMRLPLDVAHLDDKGMGGDHGTRTIASRMIRLCRLRHTGPVGSLHSQDVKVTPIVNAQGTDGPCVFSERIRGRWVIVGVESSPGVLSV